MIGNRTAAESAIITTWSGRHIDLLRPDPFQVHIDDIAYALARTMRFNGHTSRPYSAAEHCILGAGQCIPANKLEFLLHDAAEAYLGDMVGPLKDLSIFAIYRELEAQWSRVIALRFGLRVAPPRQVHVVDKRMLVTEMRDLMGRMPLSTDKFQPFPMRIGPAPESVAERFLAKFDTLVRKTEGARR